MITRRSFFTLGLSAFVCNSLKGDNMAFDSLLDIDGGRGLSYFGNSPQRHILQNSNGDLYALIVVSTLVGSVLHANLKVDKSIDNGVTWNEVTGLALTTTELGFTHANGILDWIAYPKDDSFSVLFWGQMSGTSIFRLAVKQLNTLTETWNTLMAPSDGYSFYFQPYGGIVVRSDNSVVISYENNNGELGPTGDICRRPMLRVYSGSWGSEIEVPVYDEWSPFNYSMGPIGLELTDSDRVRVFYVNQYGSDVTLPLPDYGNSNHQRLMHTCWNGSGFGTPQLLASDYFIPQTPYTFLGQAAAYTDINAIKKLIVPYGTYNITPYRDGRITSITLNNAGSGYSVGWWLSIMAGNEDATIEVTSVGGSGEILTFDLVDAGTGYTTATGVVGEDFDTGDGATFDIVADPIQNLEVNGVEVKTLHGDDVDTPTWSVETVFSSSTLEWPGPGNTFQYPITYGTNVNRYKVEVLLGAVANNTNVRLFWAMNEFDASGQIRMSDWNGSTWSSSLIFRRDQSDGFPTYITGYAWGVSPLTATKVLRAKVNSLSYISAVHLYSSGLTAVNYVVSGGNLIGQGNYVV